MNTSPLTATTATPWSATCSPCPARKLHTPLGTVSRSCLADGLPLAARWGRPHVFSCGHDPAHQQKTGASQLR